MARNCLEEELCRVTASSGVSLHNLENINYKLDDTGIVRSLSISADLYYDHTV